MAPGRPLILGLPRTIVAIYVVVLLGTATTAAVLWHLALSPPPRPLLPTPALTRSPSPTPLPRPAFALAATPSVAIVPENVAQVQLLAVWDAAPCAARGLCPEIPTSLDVSPDGQTVVTGSSDGVVRIRRLADGVLVRAWPVNVPLTDVAFSPYGRSVATAAWNGLGLWRTADGSFVDRVEFPREWLHGAPGVAFVPDGLKTPFEVQPDCQPGWWVVDRYQTVGVWFSKRCGGRRIAFQFAPLAISRNGEKLAVGNARHDVLGLWRLPPVEGPLGAFYVGPPTLLYAIALNPDGRLAAFAYGDGTLRLRRPEDCPVPRATSDACAPALAILGGHPGEPDWQHEEDAVLGVAFSPDGRLLVTVSRDGLVREWGVK